MASGVSSGSVESLLLFFTGFAGLQPLASVMELVGWIGSLVVFSGGSVGLSLIFTTELAGPLILYPKFVMFLDGVWSGRMEECFESH